MGNLFCFRGAPKIRISAPAVFYAGFLSWLFIAVYGGCNEWTSRRSDVGIWVYAWEYWIPFISLMVIPYMSIDFFFGLSPFLCETAEERRLLAARISFGILAAGTFYLLFPLKLAIERGYPDGWIGVIWNTFLSADKPYNLLPSLHITLRTLLADTYARHMRGGWRIASHTWFSLIGFSTVLTHQHHVVDIAGGFVMATLCFYVFHGRGWVSSLIPNYRVFFLYAIGGILAGWLAPLFWSCGFFLLWTGLSMGIIAGAYVVWGPAVFRKTDGVLALSARILLAPVLFGQRLSLWYYSRQCDAWNKVTESVWIGRVLNRKEAEAAIAEGLTAVLDVTGEFSECRLLRALSYKNIQVMDLTAPTEAQLDEAVEFIRREARHGKVLVHCKIGYSRSAAVVATYLLAERLDQTVDNAVQRIRNARPALIVRSEARAAIEGYFRSRMMQG